MTLFFYIIIGYLVGSISLGYFFGRVIKGIDIRKFGNYNSGASNTFRIVGPIYGIITFAVDFIKAPLVYYLSLPWLNPDLAIIVGIAAVLGHIFPFYLGFKGGRGAASLDGLFLISLIFSSPIYSLILLIGMLIYYLGFIHPTKISTRHWLKLFSIVFPLSIIWWQNIYIIWVVGFLMLTSLFFDFARSLSPTINRGYLEKRKFSKENERFFSGYTAFLLSSFIILAFFPNEIAAVSLVFFALGDVFAPFSKNLNYLPQTQLVGEKTIAGFMVVFVVSLFAGWFLLSLTTVAISIKMIVLGAFLTAFFDQVAFWVDDNLLVPMATAIVLRILI